MDSPGTPPKHVALADLAEGVRAVVDFTITAEDMEKFAALSGDYNPLHRDQDFARQKGFKGTVVYGALLIAKISGLIGMQLPGLDSLWGSIAMQFNQPLYVGEPARAEGAVVAVSKSTGLIVLKLTVRSNDRLLAMGKAEVLLAGR
jgi:3-hydroxybutyryl-CoA dehydratase